MSRPSVERASADDAVRAFWYRAYVEELGHDLPGADHARGLLADPLAEAGTLFVARDEAGRVVGTVSTVYGHRAELGFYRDWFRIPPGSQEHSLSTRLVVDPAHRRSRLSLDLACATYREGLAQGICVDHVDCQPRNRPLFERLGYRQSLPDGVHPLYGPSQRLVLHLRDHAHLQRCGSPFRRLLERSGVLAPEPLAVPA